MELRTIGIVLLICGVVITCLVLYIAELKKAFQQEQQRLETELADLQRVLDSRAKSSSAQRATIKGQLAEQFFPLMGECTYEPSDMRFMGDFCDYIVIDGYTRCKDEGDDYINQIAFIEIKTGNAQLSRHQKLIRDAVQQGRVVWNTVRL